MDQYTKVLIIALHADRMASFLANRRKNFHLDMRTASPASQYPESGMLRAERTVCIRGCQDMDGIQPVVAIQ